MKRPLAILIMVACALVSAAIVYSVFAGAMKERARIRLAYTQQVVRVVKETNKADADYLQAIESARMFDLGNLLSMRSKARKDYVDSLRKISLTGCPGDFSNAWIAYVRAWEAELNDVAGSAEGRDSMQARREVEVSALRYRVNAMR